jgi:hypothetical protein
MARSAAGEGKTTGALALAAFTVLLSPEAPAREGEEAAAPPEAEALPRRLDAPTPRRGARDDPRSWLLSPLQNPPFPDVGELWAADERAALADLLATPRRLMDAALEFVSRRVPDPADALWDGRDGDAPLLLRLLRVRVTGGEEDLLRHFLDEWLDRQRNYLAGLQEKTLGFEEEVLEPEALEAERFFRKQRRLAWGALKSVYLERYQVEARETLRRTNFGMEEWHGIDYAILPPAIVAYVVYRGFDQRFSVGPLRLSIRMEPAAEWFGLRRDLTAGLTVECRPRDCPLALLLAAGVHDGDVELDFIGIGTGTGAMMQALHRAGDR